MIAATDVIVIFILITTIIAIALYKRKPESFIVSDALDLYGYKIARAETNKLSPEFESKFVSPNTKDTLKYSANDVYAGLVYNKTTDSYEKKDDQKFLTMSDFGTENPVRSVSCSNSSINSKFQSGPIKLLPNQITCEKPNGLTAENYYKVYHQPRIPIIDNAVKGANYEVYSNFVKPQEVNKKILSYNTKGLPPSESMFKNLPVGFNYGFHDNPLIPMP